MDGVAQYPAASYTVEVLKRTKDKTTDYVGAGTRAMEEIMCDRFKGRVGYKGQKYAVMYTRDGVETQMGWQNQPSGGLEDAAKLMPGVTATRVVPVDENGEPLS